MAAGFYYQFYKMCNQSIKAIGFYRLRQHMITPSLNKVKIVIKRSYKLIPMALSRFGKSVNLACRKEVMPHGACVFQNVNMGD